MSIPTTPLHLADNSGLNLMANDSLHHGKMFEIVMSLEQCITREKFSEDTSNTPDVTRETPTQIQNDLGGTVVSSRHNWRMILIIESGRAKVDKPDLTVE